MKIVILGSGSFAGQALLSDHIIKGNQVLAINRSKPNDSIMWPWLKNFSIENACSWKSLNIIDHFRDITHLQPIYCFIDFIEA